MKIRCTLLLLFLSMTASASSICPSPTEQIGNLCCFYPTQNYSVNMIAMTKNCSAPFKYITPTCCAKFSQIDRVYTSMIDKYGVKTILIKSKFDGSIMNSEQSIDLNTDIIPLDARTPIVTQTPTTEPIGFDIDPEILTLLSIIGVVIIGVLVWILRGKDE